MTTSMAPAEVMAAAKEVRVTREALVVELRDGRVVSVPITWYPRLAEGTAAERRRRELIGPGVGIHWPDLDEDISVEGVLRGSPSGEKARHRSLVGEHRGSDQLTRVYLGRRRVERPRRSARVERAFAAEASLAGRKG